MKTLKTNREHLQTRPAGGRSRAGALGAKLLAAGLAASYAAPALGQGACCSPRGFCFLTDAVTCQTTLGWTWRGAGANCSPNLCPRSNSYVGSPMAIPDATASGPGAPASVLITVPDTITIASVNVAI